MRLLNLFASNWKIIALAAAVMGSFYAGWHGHTWYDGYKNQKAESKAAEDLGKGEAEIVNFNQNFDKEKSVAKDNCIDKPLPPNLGKLLK